MYFLVIKFFVYFSSRLCFCLSTSSVLTCFLSPVFACNLSFSCLRRLQLMDLIIMIIIVKEYTLLYNF
jgi:hypothetical protein